MIWLSTLLSLVAPSAAALAEEPGLVVYHCENSADRSPFTLTYELRGSRISNVSVGHFGVPRLGSDTDTRWRGRMVGDDVEFTFGERSGGHSLTATMKLVETDEPDRYRLTWSSSDASGHLVVESEPRTADCIMPVFGAGSGGSAPA